MSACTNLIRYIERELHTARTHHQRTVVRVEMTYTVIQIAISHIEEYLDHAEERDKAGNAEELLSLETPAVPTPVPLL